MCTVVVIHTSTISIQKGYLSIRPATARKLRRHENKHLPNMDNHGKAEIGQGVSQSEQHLNIEKV